MIIWQGIAKPCDFLKPPHEFDEFLSEITDDSSLIARAFPDVKQCIVDGSRYNIKLQFLRI